MVALRAAWCASVRVTNAFSKEVENHAYAVAPHDIYHNLVRLHGTVRVTPAMEAGITDRLWEIGAIVALVEDADAPAAKRGVYKNRVKQTTDRLSIVSIYSLSFDKSRSRLSTAPSHPHLIYIK